MTLYKDEGGGNKQRIRIHKAQSNETNEQHDRKVSDETDSQGECVGGPRLGERKQSETEREHHTERGKGIWGRVWGHE
jgi:hypothetical protein